MALVNTRTSLWPARWPAIALDWCIEKVENSKPEDQAKVKANLPCIDCPESSRCLNAKRLELGALLFDREFMTRPRSSESSLFPMELFEPMLLRNEAQVKWWRKPYGVEERYGICQAWDLAWSERIGGDYLVCMTGLIDRKTAVRRVLEIERWQRVSFDDQIKLIEAKWSAFGPDLVVIEGDAAQKIWTQHLGRNSAVPVLAHNATSKRDFQTGVPGLLIKLEQGKWAFPYARDTHQWAEMDNFLAEAEAFGWVDGKLEGVGEHDDTVMCFWHMDWGLDRLSMIPLNRPKKPRDSGRGAYI